MSDAQQKKVEVIDAFLMRLVSENVEADPLYRMKNNQYQQKQQHCYRRQRV
jgi:hypothetical protein